MTSNKKTLPMKIIVTAIVSALAGAIITSSIGGFSGTATTSIASKKAEKKPLYWVSPMDANYKRDKPGKSPMGMDLIPYYGENGSGPDAGKGTIRVNPDVINNLGVRLATAQVTDLHSRIDTVGYVTYNEDKLVHIHPRVQGWIEKLYVKAEGDEVVDNQALYDIYSPELVNAQEELIIALERKNKRLISAAKNRLVALQIPQKTIDTLVKNRKVQQRITFYAPQGGVIENLNIREGVFVKPGTTIMSIGDLSEVWVEAEVFERQASEVKNGTPVTMTLDYLPGKTYQGKVDYIYPTLDAKTRTVKVRLRFDNPTGEFKPNMFAQVAIHTSGDAALLIPKEALIRTGSQDRVVLALGQGSFKSIAVTVGRYDNQNVEVLSGLSVGDKVVSSAQFLLDSESSKTSDFKRMNHGVDDADMKGMDMKGMDMKGMDMKGMDMKGMDMKDMDMKGMDMKDMDMKGMDMKDMGMKDMDMKGMDMKDMDMKDMDMKDMDMKGMDMKDMDMKDMDMKGMDMSNKQGKGE